jgi:homoprotocatechuate degradation regulator HpaR
MKMNSIHLWTKENILAHSVIEPRPMRRTLPYALLRAREGTMALFRPLLSSHGLSEQYWRVIRILHEFGELDIGELSHHALILGPSLSRMIKTMRTRKLVVVRNGRPDQRRTMVRNSAQAEQLIERVTMDSVSLYQEIERDFTPQDMDKLFHFLELLAVRRNK